MVVDLSIEAIKANKETDRFVEDLHDYTVFLYNHRILTVSTSSVKMATKWLKSVLKSLTDNTSGEIFVGVSVDRRSKTLPCRDPRDSPYDLLQLCTGCRCLLYKLHHRNSQFSSPKDFNLFLKNSRVFCFLIGSRLFEMVQSQSPSASSRSGIKRRTKTKKIRKGHS